MHVAPRSYLSAGIAALGAGAIALSPIQPLPAHATQAPERVVSDLAVNLAATVDPIQLWQEVIDRSVNNFGNLWFSYWEQPLPIASTILYNQYTYIAELFNGEGSRIPGQISDNFQTFFSVQTEVNLNTLDARHQTAWALLPALVDVPANLQPVLDLTTTLSSGQVIGLVGPALAGTIALTNSISAIRNAPDSETALSQLINLPARIVDANLNGGQTLDLTSLLSSILPAQITKAGITFGGMLSPGGSLFNSLDVVAKQQIGTNPITGKPIYIEVPIPGNPTGLAGSSIEQGQQIAEAIDVGPFVPTPPTAAEPGAAVPAAAAAVAETPEEVAVETDAVADIDVDVAAEPEAPAGRQGSDAPDAGATGGDDAGQGHARAPRGGRGA